MKLKYPVLISIREAIAWEVIAPSCASSMESGNEIVIRMVEEIKD